MIEQAIAPKLGVQHWLACTVETDYVEAILPDIDAVYRESFDALLHGGLLPRIADYSVLSLGSERTIPLLLRTLFAAPGKGPTNNRAASGCQQPLEAPQLKPH
jgi:hypothetical protein